MKYKYRIDCVGGCVTLFESKEEYKFNLTLPEIRLRGADNILTIINTRNVVRIEQSIIESDEK
jgi:hypothetical protein